MKRLDILRTNLSSITNKNYDAEITADATRAREAIKRAKSELNNFAKQRAKAKLDVNMKAASSKVEIFKAMLRSIPNVVRTRLEVDGNKSLGFFKSLGKAIDESTRTWDKLATKIRTIGTVLGLSLIHI